MVLGLGITTVRLWGGMAVYASRGEGAELRD